MRVREIYSRAQILPLTFSFLFSFLLLFSVFVKRRIKREERSLASLAIWASSSPVPPVAQGPAGLCLTNPSEPRAHRSPSAARRPSLDLLLLSISLWCPTPSLPRRRDPLLLPNLPLGPSLARALQAPPSAHATTKLGPCSDAVAPQRRRPPWLLPASPCSAAPASTSSARASSAAPSTRLVLVSPASSPPPAAGSGRIESARVEHLHHLAPSSSVPLHLALGHLHHLGNPCQERRRCFHFA